MRGKYRISRKILDLLKENENKSAVLIYERNESCFVTSSKKKTIENQ